MRLLASFGARERCRTLVAQDGAVWIWPGIHLTLQRGGEIVPVVGETIRFWVTRLHGPEALYKDLLSGVSRAAWCLTTDNEAKAQHALDGIGLITLSHVGAALMKAVSRELGVAALNLPVRDGPRTWNAQDIAQHLPIFEDSVGASRILAKGVVLSSMGPNIHAGLRVRHIARAGNSHRPMKRVLRSFRLPLAGSVTMAGRLWKTRQRFRRTNRHRMSESI